MQSPVGAPRPRSRKTPLATLLALLALATGAQALAPAGAGAIIADPPTPGSCAAMMGSWINGACYIVDDAGNPVMKVNEISWATPNTPAPKAPCSICGVRVPQQIGDGGAGGGREKGTKSGSKTGGSGEVKTPADDKKKDKGKKNDPAEKPKEGPAKDPKQAVCVALAKQMLQLTGLPKSCISTQVSELRGSVCAKAILGVAGPKLALWKAERERWAAELLQETAKGDGASREKKVEIAKILKLSETASKYLMEHRDAFVAAQCMMGAPLAAAPAAGGS